MAEDRNIHQATTDPQRELKYSWDFFLAHAGPDLSMAKILYDKLDPPAKVFLDAESLFPGDSFAEELSKALHSSLISVIIISPNTEKAYYEQEEIAIAIERTRADPDTHRVVPLYIDSNKIPPERIPYGLKGKHSLYVPASGDFTETGIKLLKTLEMMKGFEIKKDQVVEEQLKAVTKITDRKSNADVISGFIEITKFIRPLLNTLLVLLVLMIGVLFTSIFIASEVRGLMIAVSGSLCALLLLIILWLVARSLKYAPEIAKGNINGG